MMTYLLRWVQAKATSNMCVNRVHPQKHLCITRVLIKRKSTKATTIKKHVTIVLHMSLARIYYISALWHRYTLTMALTIDARERALIQQLVKADVEHTVATLPLGDVCFRSDRCTWLAERKRADDLAQSIKSGRWREQLGRLFSSHATCIVLI